MSNTVTLSQFQIHLLTASQFFDITCVGKICDLCDIPGYHNNPHYINLRSLHCINYADMTADIKTVMVDELTSLLGQPMEMFLIES